MNQYQIGIAAVALFVIGCTDGTSRETDSMASERERRFAYLSEVAAAHGIDDVRVSTREQEIIDALTAEDLEDLARAYREIEQRGDAEEISKYIREDRGQESRQLLMLFFLYSGLANRGVEPFASKTVRLVPEEETLDWTKLPHELRYLAVPAERYGEIQFPLEIQDFLETMSTEQETELKQIAQRMKIDGGKIERFLDTYNIKEHRESQLVYFLQNIVVEMIESGESDEGG